MASQAGPGENELDRGQRHITSDPLGGDAVET